MEQQLNASLFTRDNNRMQLTAAGRRFLIVVQDALNRLQEGVLHLDPESLAGELIIAATPTVSINWLLQVLSSYSQRYPEVEVRVVTIEPHQRELPRQFDLALCLGQPDTPGRRSRKLYQEYYFPVCSPALIQPDQPIANAADLLRYTLLHEKFQHWEEWFALHGIHDTRAQGNIHFDYGFQSIEAARQGLGVVLADQLEVATDIRQGNLVRILDQVLPVDDGIFLVSAPPAEETVRARLFSEELFRCLEDLGAELG